jgi:nitrous oxidase accessory protein NosD
LAASLLSQPASAATVRVQAGQDLQAAVQAAAPGDTVEVERGFYRVNLRIDKALTLRGLDRPTLSGGQVGDTIRVTAPDVVLEGLIVRDSGTSLKDQNAGIYIYPGAHRAVVRKNDLTYNLFGLWIEKVNDVRVEHNTHHRPARCSTPPSAAMACSCTTPSVRTHPKATTSALCAMRCMWMCRTTPPFVATSCTTAVTARTT